jgi:gas vesicle protein
MNESHTIYRGFNAGHVLLALFAGAVAGAGVAVLTAPSSGAATRDRLRTIAHDTNNAAHHVPEAVRKATEAAREAFVTALELGADADDEEVVVIKRKRSARQGNATA